MHALQSNRRTATTTVHSRTSKLLSTIALAATLIGWSVAGNAAEYAIQVGAFKNPNAGYAENLRGYGEVNTAQSNSITVFTVGRYGSVAEANADLGRIEADYPGAFVRNMPAAARSVATASPRPTAAVQSTSTRIRTTPDTQLWESLSDSERRRVVYLDGVLHLKQGDQFVPLAEYRRNQQ